jgi:hypothetical protein
MKCHTNGTGTAGTFFFVKFFYKINTNSTVGKNLNCQVIVAVKMNEFPERSRAPTSKRTSSTF